jgi:hypothetical protein
MPSGGDGVGANGGTVSSGAATLATGRGVGFTAISVPGSMN